MIAARYIPLIFKQVLRHRTRTLLTVGGVATAMFLFCAVQAMQRAVAVSTAVAASDTTLVVYRENRFCPFTSRLPEHYLNRIASIPGVRSVVPIKIVVSNCRASLDVVTFRGVPAERFEVLASRFTFLSGSVAEWNRRGDAAILGQTLAARRGLKVGESFDAAGITVNVAGIISSDEPQDQNVAYTHLDFLQRAASRGGPGIVTQFNVKVDDHTQLPTVAAAIDEEFRSDSDPTQTRPEKAFVAAAATDIVEIVGFTRWLGWACLAAVLALVGNAIILSVQDRIKEHAILQTLGFRSALIARLIVGEGLLLSVLGGSLGTLAAAAFLRWAHISLTVEAVSMNVTASLGLVGVGMLISAVLGVVAGLIPAWQASRREIAACFRAV